MSVRAKTKLGFGMNADGQIVPLTKDAYANYRMGLDDDLKFHKNRKSVSELQCEQFRLRYKRDEYILPLTEEEEAFCRQYAAERGLAGPGDVIVGFNTGCSELYPNKKMTIEQHVALHASRGEPSSTRRPPKVSVAASATKTSATWSSREIHSACTRPSGSESM